MAQKVLSSPVIYGPNGQPLLNGTTLQNVQIRDASGNLIVDTSQTNPPVSLGNNLNYGNNHLVGGSGYIDGNGNWHANTGLPSGSSWNVFDTNGNDVLSVAVDGSKNVIAGGGTIVQGVLTPNGGIAGALGGTGANSGNPIGWNLLPNSSWRLGSAFWSGIGSNGFAIQFGGYGEGGYLYNGSSNSGTSDVWVSSVNIPMNPGVPLVLSANLFASGVSAGGIGVDLAAYNSSGTLLGSVRIAAPNGANWQRYSATYTTPANTAYVVVQPKMFAGTTNTSSAWRRIKLEVGSIATPYTAEADLWPFLAANYNGLPWEIPSAIASTGDVGLPTGDYAKFSFYWLRTGVPSSSLPSGAVGLFFDSSANKAHLANSGLLVDAAVQANGGLSANGSFEMEVATILPIVGPGTAAVQSWLSTTSTTPVTVNGTWSNAVVSVGHVMSTASYILEVLLGSSSTTATAYATLWDINNGAVVSGTAASVTPAATGTPYLARSGPLTLTAGHNYTVALYSSTTAATAYVYGARLVAVI